MAKKQKEQLPKEKPFRTSCFDALKKVVVSVAESKEKIAPVKPVTMKQHQEKSESDLFLDAMKGIAPLEPRGEKKAAEKKPENRVVKVAPEPVSDVEKDVFLGELAKLKLEVTFSDSIPLEQEITPLSGDRLRLLKKGVIKIERQLDLHGLTREEALLELPRFVSHAREKGEKGILVITGKGNHSKEAPVLQQAVISWLRDAGRELVSEFMPAPREMGGSGALLLFLKHKKY